MWQPVSYGGGKRHWYVVREIDGRPIVAADTVGRYRRFGSYVAALSAAQQLNGMKP